jgi:hypothetical protein
MQVLALILVSVTLLLAALQQEQPVFEALAGKPGASLASCC